MAQEVPALYPFCFSHILPSYHFAIFQHVFLLLFNFIISIRKLCFVLNALFFCLCSFSSFYIIWRLKGKSLFWIGLFPFVSSSLYDWVAVSWSPFQGLRYTVRDAVDWFIAIFKNIAVLKIFWKKWYNRIREGEHHAAWITWNHIM